MDLHSLFSRGKVPLLTLEQSYYLLSPNRYTITATALPLLTPSRHRHQPSCCCAAATRRRTEPTSHHVARRYPLAPRRSIPSIILLFDSLKPARQAGNQVKHGPTQHHKRAAHRHATSPTCRTTFSAQLEIPPLPPLYSKGLPVDSRHVNRR